MLKYILSIAFLCFIAHQLPAQISDTGSVNQAALAKLNHEAVAANSDAFLIIQGDSILVEWYADGPQPIEIMSCLKSVVSLGIGRLLFQGKIDSLDQPVHTFYPEWKQGRKQEITIRHILNHTSGIQNVPNAGAEIYPAPNAVQLALAAELSADPGEEFSYNNKAVNLLAGIFEKTSGLKMDQYFKDEIFIQMNIDDFKWYKDKSGTPHAMAGLELKARDFAKFGELVVNNGMWRGERLLSKAFIHEMLAQGQPHYPLSGLLWWRIPEYRRYSLTKASLEEFQESGVDATIIRKLSPLAGSILTSREDYFKTLTEVLGPDWRKVREEEFRAKGFDDLFESEYGDIVGYYAEGYLGQYLVVIPEADLVAVRQIKRTDSYNSATDTFQNFVPLLVKLINR